MSPAVNVPSRRAGCRGSLLFASLLAVLPRPGLAQGCSTDKGMVSGSITIGDRSTAPCDAVDLWAVPESGDWLPLGKFPWGTITATVPRGVWRFAAYACGPYLPFRQSSPVRCLADAQGCVRCPDRFELPMYAMFGGFSGQVTLLPEDVPAGPGVPVGAAVGLTCAAEQFAYTDDSGRYALAPAIEPHRSNHWGLPVDGDGSSAGSRQYFMNADYCENGITATTYSSTDVTVNLFRVAPYMAVYDPSIRPLVQPPLVPARPPREVGPGIGATTGNVALDQTDVAAWGAPSSLTFVRSYNSRIAAQRLPSPLGAGWSHTYGAQISSPVSRVLMLLEDNGAPRYFQDKEGDNVFRPSVPILEASIITKTAKGYTRRFTEGGEEEFDAQGRLLRRLDAVGRVTVLRRDGQGRLSSVVDPDGRSLQLAYDEQGHLSALSSGSTVVATYAHDEAGALRRVTYPDGSGFALTYDDSGQLLTVGESSGRILRTYTYEGNRAKTFEIAAGRERVSVGYSPLRTTVTDVLGRVTAYEWSNFRGMRLVTAAVGRCPDCGPPPPDPLDPRPALPSPPIAPPPDTRALPMWAALLLPPWPLTSWPQDAAVDWPIPRARIADQHTWTYDLQGRLLSHRGGEGTTTHVAYSPAGWPITITDSLGRATRITRDVAGRVTAISAPSVADPARQRSTSYAYDAKGRLTARTETGLLGDGALFRAPTQLSYDAAGRLVRADGPVPEASDSTTYSYDESGNLAAIVPVDWLAMRFTDSTPFGWPRRTTDANGRTVVYTYGAQGRVTSIDDAGDVTKYAYTPAGALRRIERPRGNGAIFTYDAYDRLVEVRNAADHQSLFTYDMAGQRTRDQVRTGPGSERERAFDYDRLGRVSQVVVGDARYEIDYDGGGRVIAVRAPGTDGARYEYDAGGRVFLAQFPGGPRITGRYDARDRLVAATDNDGVAYTYAYDDMGRIHRRVDPSGATTSFGYDLSGRLTSRIDGRGAVTFERDGLGRVLRVRLPNDRGLTYVYDICPDGRGRLCEVTDASGRTTFAYTPKGLVAEQTRHAGTTSFVTGYSYDRNGNLSSLRYPSGRVVTYALDDADHPRSISTASTGPMEVVANLSYGADGTMSAISYANGVGLAIARDPTGRVRAIRGVPLDLTYSYDARGDVTAISGAERGQTFTYGPGRQLMGAVGSWGAVTWSYDGVGNRIEETSAGIPTMYAYAPRTQRLTSVAGAETTLFGYDATGRVVRAGDERFVYDDLGRLVIVGGPHRTGEYAYDYKGRRVSKTARGTTTLFIYDLQDRLIAESTPDGTVVAEYLYDQDRPIAYATRTSLAYVHVDAFGAPVAMTNAKAEKVWSLDLRPFGDGAIAPAAPTSLSAPGAGRKRVTRPAVVFNLRGDGHYFDEETGRYHGFRRTYDPLLGRYLEPNACARPGELAVHSVYGYAAQNPFAFAAPEGLEARPRLGAWASLGALWDAWLPSPGGRSPGCAVPPVPD